MKIYNLNNFIKGWIIGDFEPSLVKTKDFEISIKEYKLGDVENYHIHKIADEFTCVTSGKIKMNEKIYYKNDIIHIEKGESANFEALEDSITLVIKVPSVIGDKYLT